ncbi:MAG: DUF1223 domain-containing protein [Rhizobiaceae bacterium]
MELRRCGSLAVSALAILGFAGFALAGELQRPLGVVELFTSQGCNSCPAADRFLGELAEKGEVVALAYHVSYWDYLGWKDTLASEENTDRQYEYMRSFGARSVYTPQAVINGRKHVSGSDRSAVEAAIGELNQAGAGMKVGIKVTRAGDSVVIEAAPSADTSAEAHVRLVYYDPPQPIEIARGENRGTTVVYWNAVRSVHTAGIWHGEKARFELPATEIAKKGGGGCAVLLQSVGKDGAPGPILGAAVIDKDAPAN